MPNLPLSILPIGIQQPMSQKKRDVVGELLAGTNPKAGIKNYSGNKLMPLVTPNVTGQPTALPMISQTLVPTGVVYPKIKDPSAIGKLGGNKAVSFGGGKAGSGAGGTWDEQPKTNPKVASYLSSKYSKKTVEPQQATAEKPTMPVKQELELEKGEDQANERLSRILAVIGGATSAYGSGLLGQGAQGSAGQMYSNLNTIKERETETNLKNPKSAESVHARNLAKQLYGDQYKVDPNLTAMQFRESSPLLDNMFARTFKQQESDKDRAFREKELASRNAKDWAQINMQKETMGMRAANAGSRGGGSGGGEREQKKSASELKREYDKNTQNAGLNMMKDQVEDYFNTIKKIKPLGKTFNQAEAVEAQAKKAMAINTFKDTYKLGTLDSGLIEHMDRILGDTSYTTDKNIEARKKSVLQELERQNKQLSGAYDDPSYKFNPQQSQAPKTNSDTVIMVSPTGVVRRIPISDAKNAEAYGYKRR